MSRLGNVLAGALRAAVLVSFLVLIAAVVVQVVTRLWFPRSPVWTEEMSRVALLYLVAIGGGLSIRTGDLVNVDILPSALRPAARLWLMRAVAACSALFAIVLIPPAWQFVSIGGLQRSPTLGISMTWVFLPMVISLVVLAVFSIERALAPRDAGGGAGPAGDPRC